MLKYFSWQFLNVIVYTLVVTPFTFFWVSAISIYRNKITLETIISNPNEMFFDSILLTAIALSFLCFVIRPLEKFVLKKAPTSAKA